MIQNNLEKYTLYGVVIKDVSNGGEEYDDEENFCGLKSNITIHVEENLTREEVYQSLRGAEEKSADYGDGVSCAKVLAVYDMSDKESLMIDSEYWKPNHEEVDY